MASAYLRTKFRGRAPDKPPYCAALRISAFATAATMMMMMMLMLMLVLVLVLVVAVACNDRNGRC